MNASKYVFNKISVQLFNSLKVAFKKFKERKVVSRLIGFLSVKLVIKISVEENVKKLSFFLVVEISVTCWFSEFKSKFEEFLNKYLNSMLFEYNEYGISIFLLVNPFD